jgi:hypothetical protein
MRRINAGRAVDKEAALRSANELAKPWLKQGFRFGGLHRYFDAERLRGLRDAPPGPRAERRDRDSAP